MRNLVTLLTSAGSNEFVVYNLCTSHALDTEEDINNFIDEQKKAKRYNCTILMIRAIQDNPELIAGKEGEK